LIDKPGNPEAVIKTERHQPNTNWLLALSKANLLT
jgi:hypothetical protein